MTMKYRDISLALAPPDGAGVSSDGVGRVTQWAVGVLADLAARRCALDGVHHPLGFLCLPVERDGVDGVCIHIWDPALEAAIPDTGDIHCHSWDLISLVIHGSIVNKRVLVIDDDKGATHRLFEVRSRGGRDEFVATPQLVRYQTQARDIAETGEVYKLSAGLFHSTAVHGQSAATVALGHGRETGVNLSLGALDGDAPPSVRKALGAERVADVAKRWLREIGA
jgi:hypothetical protein